MIGYIKGEITYHEPTYLIVDVAGIGYELRVSLNTSAFLRDQKQCKLFTYLHIKEDAHVLYGFINMHEKNLFMLLISISGIGPNTAMIILSSMNVQEIEDAIAGSDVSTLKSIKGIGQKTAERIIVELKDKIRKGKGLEKTGDFIPSENAVIINEALAALTTLGIQKAVAEKSIQAVLKKYGRNISLEELIKLTLKSV